MGGEGSSRFITILHRGGSPQFITILHRGVLQSLLQYYRFGRNMEGLRPFSVLHIYFYVVLKVRIFSQIWKKSQICDLGKYPYIISILHRGEFLNLLQYYMGGVFPIYYNITIGGEGSTGTPNLY